VLDAQPRGGVRIDDAATWSHHYVSTLDPAYPRGRRWIHSLLRNAAAPNLSAGRSIVVDEADAGSSFCGSRGGCHASGASSDDGDVKDIDFGGLTHSLSTCMPGLAENLAASLMEYVIDLHAAFVADTHAAEGLAGLSADRRSAEGACLQ